jgi:mRNA interferase HigB
MRVTAENRIRAYWEKYPDAKSALIAFLQVVRKSHWKNLQELRKTYPHADAVAVASRRIVTVFNFRGNVYRLITAIHYNAQWMYVLRFLTHAEYSRGDWKDVL